MNIGERFLKVFENFGTNPFSLVTFILSVIVFLFAYWYIFKFLLKNNSGYLIVIFLCVSVVIGGTILLNGGNGLLFLAVPTLFLLFVGILYSVEIKRIIWTIKKGKNKGATEDGETYDEEKVENCINEIIKALQDMSKNDIGALIVLSTGNVPSQILDSGVRMESEISAALIESIFFPKTPLHDGAMIINGTSILAAGCFLPLSQKIDKIPKDLGTRHRAGIGITETMDVISLIVSEETGIISVVKAGQITRYADADILRKTLKKYFWQEMNDRG